MDEAEENAQHYSKSPFEVRIFAGLGVSVMIFFAVVGNLLVIISYIRDKQLRVVLNVYILNLAIADLLIGCISMPFYVSFTIQDYWSFGKVFCKIFNISDFTMCSETVVLTLLISLDRLLLVKLGASYTVKETMKIAYIKVSISWIISFCLYGVAIICWDLVRGYSVVEDTECDVEFYNNFEYTIVTAFCEFFIPFLLLVAFNSVIYYEIRKRGKVVPSSQRISTTCKESTQTNNSSNQAVKSTAERLIAERNSRAAKALGVLVLAFAVCWGPYSVANILVALCGECVNYHVFEFSSYLLWLKLSINPILYAFNSARFRTNFKEIISFVCPFYKVSTGCPV